MDRGAGTGAFTIAGLPFTVGASPLGGVISIRPNDFFLWTGEHSGTVNEGGTTINFYINPVNTDGALATAGADDVMKASTTVSIQVSGSYNV